jgi:hypothetical protein
MNGQHIFWADKVNAEKTAKTIIIPPKSLWTKPLAGRTLNLPDMEYHRETNGLKTFLENWWFLSVIVLAIVTSEVLSFFYNLSGMRWIYFFTGSQALLFIGAALILRAKIPVYRSGRFFTFGPKYIPENLAAYYRWGWRVFLFGVALSLCLLLSKQ